MKKMKWLPMAAAALAVGFASCTNEELEETTPLNSGKTAVFAAYQPGSEDGDAADVKNSRRGLKTTMDEFGYFKWTTGDYVFVKDADGNYVRSNNAAEGVNERENFYLSGTWTADRYRVVFSGTNKSGADDWSTVTVKANQTQELPNDGTHIGTDGDCGVSTATKQADNTYIFNIVHRATYLCINLSHAYDTNASDVRVRKITIRTTGSAPLTGIYTGFNENVRSLGAMTPTSPGHEIVLTLGDGQTGWATPAVDDVRADNSLWDENRAFVVMTPGLHSLEFEYEYTRDGSTWLTETKVVSQRDYPAGYFTNIRHILAEGLFNGRHLNAEQSQTVGDFSSDAVANGGGVGREAQTYICWDAPFNDPTAFNYSVQWPGEATQSCKDMPNVNELWWYLIKTPVYFDNSAIWSPDGGVTEYSGGFWVKKKANIAGFNSNQIEDGRDLRTARVQRTFKTIQTGYTVECDESPSFYATCEQLRPANLHEYFLIAGQAPSPVNREIGSMHNVWSRSTGIIKRHVTMSDGTVLKDFERTQAYMALLRGVQKYVYLGCIEEDNTLHISDNQGEWTSYDTFLMPMTPGLVEFH